MKTLEEQMSVYLRYHRNPKNRLTHFVGVPLIMFSLFVLLDLARFELGGFSISAATVLAVVVLVYYFRLDAVLAAAMTLFVVVLLVAAHGIASEGIRPALVVFAATFVGGWALQLVGHVFEGRKPALMDNLFQVLIAPIFLMAEVFFAFGYKRDVAERMEQMAARSEPG
ncbi:MAG TPA: Mpo1-like protein [Burkholderiaceae bacterium]|nr:Mpo1-like protein [Burkholderiaceae bacterium]